MIFNIWKLFLVGNCPTFVSFALVCKKSEIKAVEKMRPKFWRFLSIHRKSVFSSYTDSWSCCIFLHSHCFSSQKLMLYPPMNKLMMFLPMNKLMLFLPMNKLMFTKTQITSVYSFFLFSRASCCLKPILRWGISFVTFDEIGHVQAQLVAAKEYTMRIWSLIL